MRLGFRAAREPLAPPTDFKQLLEASWLAGGTGERWPETKAGGAEAVRASVVIEEAEEKEETSTVAELEDEEIADYVHVRSAAPARREPDTGVVPTLEWTERDLGSSVDQRHGSGSSEAQKSSAAALYESPADDFFSALLQSAAEAHLAVTGPVHEPGSELAAELAAEAPAQASLADGLPTSEGAAVASSPTQEAAPGVLTDAADAPALREEKAAADAGEARDVRAEAAQNRAETELVALAAAATVKPQADRRPVEQAEPAPQAVAVPVQARAEAAPSAPPAVDPEHLARKFGTGSGLSRLLGPLAGMARHFTVSGRAERTLKVVETVNLGEKRFAAVLDVQGKKFLIGGGAGNVSLLAALEQQDSPSEGAKAS